MLSLWIYFKLCLPLQKYVRKKDKEKLKVLGPREHVSSEFRGQEKETSHNFLLSCCSCISILPIVNRSQLSEGRCVCHRETERGRERKAASPARVQPRCHHFSSISPPCLEFEHAHTHASSGPQAELFIFFNQRTCLEHSDSFF